MALGAGKLIGLKGRGREQLLASGNPDEIVRMYDGIENPIGKSYTYGRILRMAEKAGFAVLRKDFYFFPKRALPFSIPRSVHRFLSRHFGLMIILICRK
jgi:hypothetical protein